MAQHPEERAHSRPIVPDPDASLAPQRFRHPPPPRVWPLWLLVVVLIATLSGLAWVGWQERIRFERQISRLGGELSNVHARFDAQQGRGEALATLQSRLDGLTEQNATLASQLAENRESVGARVAALDERLDEMAQGLEAREEAGANRDALIAATRRSLDALERAGEEGRAALNERVDMLVAARESTLARLDALEQGSVQDDTMSAIQMRLDRTQSRLETLASTLEAIQAARDEASEQRQANSGRLRDLEAELSELRRGQLVLSAQLEALQR